MLSTINKFFTAREKVREHKQANPEPARQADTIESLRTERDDLAAQLGAIVSAVAAWESLPVDKDLGLVDSIKAADVEFRKSCEAADAAMELTCKELLAAKAEILESVQATVGDAVEQYKFPRHILTGEIKPDDFTGIMDGPEMMPIEEDR